MSQPRLTAVLVLRPRERSLPRSLPLTVALPPASPRSLPPPRPPSRALAHRARARSSSSSPSPSSAMNGPSPPGRDHLSMDVSRAVMARASLQGRAGQAIRGRGGRKGKERAGGKERGERVSAASCKRASESERGDAPPRRPQPRDQHQYSTALARRPAAPSRPSSSLCGSSRPCQTASRPRPRRLRSRRRRARPRSLQSRPSPRPYRRLVPPVVEHRLRRDLLHVRRAAASASSGCSPASPSLGAAPCPTPSGPPPSCGRAGRRAQARAACRPWAGARSTTRQAVSCGGGRARPRGRTRSKVRRRGWTRGERGGRRRATRR